MMLTPHSRRAGASLPASPSPCPPTRFPCLLSPPLFFSCFSLLLGRPVFVAEQTAELRVCFLEDNLPLSSAKDSNGFDFDTAKAVAAALNRPFVPVWTKNDTRIQEIEESDFPTRKLGRNECDAIFSMPGEDSLKDAPKAALGAPYYGAAFELIAREGATQTNLNTLGDTPVAVQAQRSRILS